MKKKMRAGAAVLLFCACLLLYGCGSETGGSQEPQSTDYESEYATEQETTQPETDLDIEEIDSFRFEYDDNNMIIVSLNENGEGEKSLMAVAQLTEGNDFIAISAWLNFTMKSLYEGMDVSALFEIGDDSYFCMIYDGEDKGNTLPDTEDVKTLSDKMIKKTIKFSDELDSFLKKNGVN